MARATRYRLRGALQGTGPWAQDSIVLITSQGLSGAATWILVLIAAQTLGPAEFGVFAASIGAAQAAGIVINLGLSNWLLRELSRAFSVRPALVDDAKSLLSASSLISGGLTVVMVAVAALVAAVAGFRPEVAATLVGLVAYTGLSALANQMETGFRAQRRLRLVVRSTIIEKLALAAGIAAVLLVDPRVELLAAAYLASAVCRVLVDYLQLSSLGLRLRLAVPVSVLRNAVRDALPFLISSAGVNVFSRLDPVAIGLSSVAVAGFYGVGERLLMVPLFAVITASSALYPHLAGERGTQAGLRMSGMLALASTPVAIGGAVMTPWFVPAVFGDAYQDAIPLVCLMMAALPFIAMANGVMATLYARGCERQVAIIALAVVPLGTVAMGVAAAVVGVIGIGAAYLLRAVLFAGGLLGYTLWRKETVV